MSFLHTSPLWGMQSKLWNQSIEYLKKKKTFYHLSIYLSIYLCLCICMYACTHVSHAQVVGSRLGPCPVASQRQPCLTTLGWCLGGIRNWSMVGNCDIVPQTFLHKRRVFHHYHLEWCVNPSIKWKGILKYTVQHNLPKDRKVKSHWGTSSDNSVCIFSGGSK